MKIGILSDIHSNIYALNRVLELEKDIDNWICLGDFVGLFPAVNEVVDKMRSYNFIAIRGDHEEYLLNDRKMEYSFSGNQSIEMQRVQISSQNKEYVSSLENSKDLEIGGLKIFLLHSLSGSRRENRYKIDLDEIDKNFSSYDVVMFGDTHLPCVVYCKETVLINPGSCGFPIDQVKKSSYAVFDAKELSCDIKRFDYEKLKLLQDIKSYGYNKKLYKFVEDGYWS